ncbi:sugar efflux transporter [Lentzea sp. DG1S-22]|uniref:sugar efflux transporter n=1 Tax=Lentzea sp. DG1S-22 TaxID=3108822 RepID=UPI002E79DC8D|nr:sugar efflux transporter [Lentzea sp. DG1S-22]WVH82372.1 sugar efflux transporter [Lentzea sp. DG1S-22]
MLTQIAAEPAARSKRAGGPLMPLASIAALIGIGSALATPFLSLFLISELGSEPVAVGMFLFTTHGAMLLVGTWVGRWSDRRAVRRIVLVIGGLSGAAGFALFAVLRDYWLLLAVALTFTTVASTQVPQVFACAGQMLGGSARAPLVMSALRTLFSLTWIIGAPLGVLLIDVSGFTGLYVVTAVACALSAGVSFLWLPRLPVIRPAEDLARPAPRARILSVMTAFVLLHAANSLDLLTLPLFVTVELGETTRTAGLMLSLCAALEIPLMLGLGALAMRVGPGLLIRLGVVSGIAYYGVALCAGSVWQFAAAQLMNAVMISAVGGVGISYFQDLVPDRPGYAATLYTNAVKVSSMLSGPLLGLAQHFGYRTSYAVCLTMAVSGLVLLFRAGRRPLLAGDCSVVR